MNGLADSREMKMLQAVRNRLHGLISDKRFSEILVGSVWAMGGQVLSALFGLAAAILVARTYGAEGTGVVAVINSFLLLVTIFTLLGTNTCILRLIPEYTTKYSATAAHKVYRKTLWLVLGFSGVTGAILFFFADAIAGRVFSKPALSSYFALAAVFVIFKSSMLLNTQAVRGLRLIRGFAVMHALPQAANLLLLILLGCFFANPGIPVYALLGGFIVTGFTGWVLMEYSFRRRMKPDDPVGTLAVKDILRLSMPMLMTAAMALVIGQTGVIVLGIFRSEAEVGYYAIAVKLATLTSFTLSAINSMAASKYSELCHAGKIDELLYVARKSTKLIFWATTPVLGFLILMGKYVLGAFFGEEFIGAYGAMLILVCGQFVNSAAGSTGIFMNMTGHQKVFGNVMLVAAVLNVVLNVTLVPSLGIIGAAVAGMVSVVVWNVFCLIYIKIRFGKSIGYVPLLKLG